MLLNEVMDDFWMSASPHLHRGERWTQKKAERHARFESFDFYKSYPTMYMKYLREGLVCGTNSSSGHGDTTITEGTAEEMAEVEPSSTDQSASDFIVKVPSQRIGNSEPRDESVTTAYDSGERNEAVRWVLHVVIAVTVGFVAVIISYSVEMLQDRREHLLVGFMRRGTFLWQLLAYFVDLCSSAGLVAVAAGVVVFFEPAAAGGGIPDVMAYLNGVQVPKAMALRTFIVKSISCVCSVAGGLPVGLEAPLIHLGAITGAGVTQGRSRALRCQTRLFQAFRNNKDRRDFITAGAACGVSAAFGAPIGGLLFVMEEVSSFWDHSSSGQIFLATMVCFSIVSIFRSIIEDQRLLGWVSNAVSVLFEVNLSIPLNVYSIVPSFLLGIVCGLFAAVFTKVNIMLIIYRRKHTQQSSVRRFLEPIIAVVLFNILSCIFAMLSSCSPLQEMGSSDNILVWGTENATGLFTAICSGNNTYSPLATLMLGTERDNIRHLFSRQTIGEFRPHQLLLFLVIYTVFACWSSGMSISGGLVIPSLVIGAALGRLFGLFICFVGMGDIGVERGYASTLAWMDPGLFALIGAGAFLAGISRMTMSICVIMVELSSELHYLLPTMVAIIMAKTVADVIAEPLYHQILHLDAVPYLKAYLMRPEFEQLTAADVMTSHVVTLRLKENTSLIMRALQMTTHHAFPVLEEVRKGAMPWGDQNGLVPVERQNAANLWGAVGEEPTCLKFVGIVTREDLLTFLSLPQLREPPSTSVGSRESEDNPLGRLTPRTAAVNQMTWTDWMAHKTSLFFTAEQARSSHMVFMNSDDGESGEGGNIPGELDVRVPVGLPLNEECLPHVLDISLIVNRSPWVIPPFFNLEMAYQTFRMMGLRHMAVVDGDAVVGIITRKDLLSSVLDQRLRELKGVLSSNSGE